MELAPGLSAQIAGGSTMQDRLFRTPTGYQATIRLEPNGWWTAIVDRFYEGEPWSETDRCVYENCSLAEATDCLLGEILTLRL